MIPFDGLFAQNYVYPFALGAYDAMKPPAGYAAGTTAFAIMADTAKAKAALTIAQPKNAAAKPNKMMQSMLDHPSQPPTAAPSAATLQRSVGPRSATPNNHFGWICLDAAKRNLVVAFRGTQYFHDWLDDLDFIPAPYTSIPGRGTVHAGFQLVYNAVRDSVRGTVQNLVNAGNCDSLLITGHSLGGALCGLSAPDLLNDIAAGLSPTVYSWAEPRVGHDDFVSFFNTHVNVCYRIVNQWDVLPHLPPDLAGYEHEGNQLTIDSGFFPPDVVRYHELATGYFPALQTWNRDHPLQPTRRFGIKSLGAIAGKTV
jgi:triacylglycerol lipase